MRFCTECGAPLADNKNFCTRRGKQVTILKEQNSGTIQPDLKTARIHGISGSTKYLLNGTRPIRGKKLTTLDELHHLHDHYEEIIAETQVTLGRHYDEIIFRLTNDESRLHLQLQEAIARQTEIIDREIGECNSRLQNADGFFARTRCRLHYWVAVALRSHHTHSPLKGDVKELNRIRHDKITHINTKASAISSECYNISRSHEFLKQNQSFLIGADGEEYVIKVLSRLPAEYHVINDVNIHFDRAIYWKKKRENIKNCQIDHIVVGPTGIFLLETKNWKSSDIELKSDKLKHQVQRASLSLWYYLKDYYRRSESPKIRTVIVSMKGAPYGKKPDQFIDIVTPRRLCKYITERKTALSEDAVNKLVRLVAKKGNA